MVMRFAISPELSAFIAARIANYAAEATEEYRLWEAPAVAEFDALPLIRHWYETFGLRADGEVVRWHTDGPDTYPGVRAVETPCEWVSALAEGARRYPELQVLLPARPANAVACRCGGDGFSDSPKFICPACGGLGWVEA
jgi:hypothetical protein